MARRESTPPPPAKTVNPSVWADALRQADGDPARIEIVSPTSVVVHNRADWRDHAPVENANGAQRRPGLENESDSERRSGTERQSGTEREPGADPARSAIPVAHPLVDPSADGATTTGPVTAQPIQVPTFVAPPRLDRSDSDD